MFLNCILSKVKQMFAMQHFFTLGAQLSLLIGDEDFSFYIKNNN
jgi:hypothetical protein